MEASFIELALLGRVLDCDREFDIWFEPHRRLGIFSVVTQSTLAFKCFVFKRHRDRGLNLN